MSKMSNLSNVLDEMIQYGQGMIASAEELKRCGDGLIKVAKTELSLQKKRQKQPNLPRNPLIFPEKKQHLKRHRLRKLILLQMFAEP